MNKSSRIKTFYTERMSLEPGNENSSHSPEKPKRLINYLNKNNLLKYFDIEDTFKPFELEDFYIAHHKDYVNSFFSDQPEKRYKRLLGLSWNKKFADTTRYTNASLYSAIYSSIKNPQNVCFSPTSGFHHAIPKKGTFYCSFSGQVIASMKIYKEFGLSGCYIDLDGHYGNSIDNSYDYVDDLEKAIPPQIGNINIESKHQQYLDELEEKLQILEDYIRDQKIHYLVFCHGADSHEWDDLGSQLTTDEWIKCSEIFYNFILRLQKEFKKHIPLSLCLFGGYRKDDYDSVLSLHTADLVKCLNILCGQNINYVPEVKAKDH
jgi:acetoin utilization deacetylase AcuC-like enzyme